MVQFLPPISRIGVRFFKLAHWAAIRLPVSEEPVKDTNLTPVLATRAAPVSPLPWTKFITPGYLSRPASSNTRTNASAHAGVSSDGLRTTVLPQSNAGATFHDGIAIGKFQGVINAATPMGMRTDIANL